jgi:lipopolysaccharide/colanic/teichoic acid biosynthesis glycosyltransferase
MMRRCVDILAAIFFLIALSPLFPLISLIVILDSPGNPFYGGWRAGKDGLRFRMWKFRTMVANADRLGIAITTRRDPRVTRTGWFLRKTKLDELPQFVNLLTGDLTLVGPRPEDPAIASHYTSEQRQILKVKPGITGPTQIFYTVLESETIPEGPEAQEYYINHILNQKIQMDLEYLKKRTTISDLHIISQTVLLMARLSGKTQSPGQSKSVSNPS